MAAPAACMDPRIKGCRLFYFTQTTMDLGVDGTQKSLCGLSGNSRVKLPPQTKPSSQPPTAKTSVVLRALQMVPMSEMQASCPACGFDVATPVVTRFTDTPSPFLILISNNGIVSTSDEELLSHYLQGVQADISAQNDVIQRIKFALTRAENEKNRLQGVFDSHAALSLPFMEDHGVIKPVPLGSFPSLGLRKPRLDALVVANRAGPFTRG
ncbi:hypothetical protein EDD85DRAFT_798608 [Armillaria nabsnona]|nr:hypothetical protein EDD85DRAFT_798608 [Armillaria nabsnona]